MLQCNYALGEGLVFLYLLHNRGFTGAHLPVQVREYTFIYVDLIRTHLLPADFLEKKHVFVHFLRDRTTHIWHLLSCTGLATHLWISVCLQETCPSWSPALQMHKQGAVRFRQLGCGHVSVSLTDS